MSTKIYTAYRLKRSKDLWPLVRDIKRVGRKNVQKEISKLYVVFRANVDASSEEYKNLVEKHQYSDWSARHSLAQRRLREGYREQLGKSERSEFNFDVNLGIWEHAGTMYLIPYCDMFMRDCLKFLKREPRLTDFSYWNNTDQPKHITQREWNARGRVWDAIDAAGWENHLGVDICSWTGWYLIDPWLDLAKKHALKSRTSGICTPDDPRHLEPS